jgi:hypothetical protein
VTCFLYFVKSNIYAYANADKSKFTFRSSGWSMSKRPLAKGKKEINDKPGGILPPGFGR